MLKLGSRVKDTISGFTGILTARTEWLYGCIRVSIEPEVLHEGKPIEAQWFDEERVVELEAPIEITPSESTGGPQKDPSYRIGK